MAAALEARHFPGQELRVAAIPAVGNEEGYRAAAQHPPGPAVVESLDRLADAGAAGPVGDGVGYLAYRPIYAPMRQMAGDAGQAGGEQEGLNRRAGGGNGVDEVQQHPGVAFHRAADIANQHQRTAAGFPPAPRNVHHLAPVGQTAAHTPAQVSLSAGAFAPGPATGTVAPQIPRQLRHHRLRRRRFRGGVFGEVPLAQHFAGAEGTLEVNYRLAVAGVVRRVIRGRAVGGILPVRHNAGRAVAPFLPH